MRLAPPEGRTCAGKGGRALRGRQSKCREKGKANAEKARKCSKRRETQRSREGKSRESRQGKCKEEGMHSESKETQRSRQGMARPGRSTSPFRRRQKKISAGNRARQKKRYAAKKLNVSITDADRDVSGTVGRRPRPGFGVPSV